MFNNKYSNILTMILVVLIVAILGIIGYFGYDMITAKAIKASTQSAIEEFEKATKKNVKRDTSNLSKTNTTNTSDMSNSSLNDSLEELNNLMEEQNKENNPSVEENPEGEEEKIYHEGFEVKGTIEIPKTKVKCLIFAQLAKKTLEMGTTIAYGPGLNQPGNTVIYGHNYRNELFFSNNKKLKIGDEIHITDTKGEKVTYEIYNMYETTPNDAEYMTRAVDEGVREISLQTCTDDSSGRIIIWAKEKI